MIIDLSHEDNFNPVYLPLFNSEKRYRILYGGRDSGKSDFVAQWTIIKLLTSDFLRMLLVRKYERSIKSSQFQTIVDYIQMWKLQDLFKITVNPLEIFCKQNGNFIRSRGLDNPDSALSTKDPNCFWYEEADQISFEAFLQTSASARTSRTNEIYEWLTFNPRKKSSWINSTFFPAEASYENDTGDFTFVESIHPEAEILHTTYKHNRYCTAERRKLLESFQQYDNNYYRVNTLGLWGGALKGLIYPNFEIIDAFPDGVDFAFGLDYGFNNPSAFVKVGYANDTIYLDEQLYANSLTHTTLTGKLKNEFSQDISKHIIVVDSAEPALIKHLRSHGFNAIPAQKKSGTIKSVYDGIMYTKQFKICVTKNSINLLDEIEGYSWKTDKDGKIYDEPVKISDHLMDAFRYVAQTYGIRNWKKQQNSVILDRKNRTNKRDKFKGF